MAKIANIFGATGLTGKYLLDIITSDPRYSFTRIFVRKDIGTFLNSETIKADFENLWKYESLIKGDEAFCCIGTTIKKAGTKEAFRKADLELVVKIAEYAKANGVSHFIVMSSIGANPASKNFYLRTKGEMEEALKKIEFKQLSIVRPSMLIGPRKETRFGESFGKIAMKLVGPLLLGGLRKYRGIHAFTVAKAMIAIANLPVKPGIHIYESDKLQELGND